MSGRGHVDTDGIVKFVSTEFHVTDYGCLAPMRTPSPRLHILSSQATALDKCSSSDKNLALEGRSQSWFAFHCFALCMHGI